MYITICKTEASGNLLYDAGSPKPLLCDSQDRWEGVGGGKEVQREGTRVYLWLIDVDVSRTQHNIVK